MLTGLDSSCAEANLAYTPAAKHRFFQCFPNPNMEMGKGGDKQKWKSDVNQDRQRSRTDKEHFYCGQVNTHHNSRHC
jgi:hypothetical protein